VHWITAIGCFLCSAALLPAQTAGVSYTIFGRVSLPNGAPATQVTVKAERQGGASRETLTDDSGRYEIPELPRGRYYVTAVNPADPDQFTDPVEADMGRQPGVRVQANIYLRYRSKVVLPKESHGSTVTLAEELQTVPKAAQKAFDQAIKQRFERQYEKALKSFDRSIEVFPEFFQAYSERGHLRIAMGDAGEAGKDFAQALKINPGYAPALRGSGICKFEQGKYAEAVQDLERAAGFEPGNATIYLFMGVANVALDRRVEARAALRKALSIDPAGSARAHVHLANLWIKEDRPREAVQEIDTYLGIVPNAPDAEKLRTIAGQLRGKIPPPENR